VTADRELWLTCVPYNTPTWVPDEQDGGRDVREVFRRGAFLGSNPASVRVLVRHEGAPVGRVLTLTEDQQGLRARVVLHRSPAADEALRLVRSGVLGGVSVGFVPRLRRETRDEHGPLLERRLVRLTEVSLVPEPAYSGTTVRTADQVERERVRLWLWLNEQRRQRGEEPLPLPRRRSTRDEAPAAPVRAPRGGGQLLYHGGGRVLGIR
jgi:hypothetical protein